MQKENKFGQVTIYLLGAALLLFANAWAVDLSDWEYEWDEGYHQEEWYDPSDWFDTDAGVSYETDWFDYTYGYNYYDPYYENEVFGYYGDDALGYDYDWYDDELYDYDYYTDTWYDEGPYEAWYE